MPIYPGSVGESWPALDQSQGPLKNGLYVVVRADLPIGVQMAQIGHAAFEFARSFHGLVGPNIYVLAARDEPSLALLVSKAAYAGLSLVSVNEPDLGGALTAAAFPGDAARLLRRLPLAGRQPPGAPANCGGAMPGPPGA